MIEAAALALFQKGAWSERCNEVARRADRVRRPEVARLAYKFQKNCTKYILEGHDQAERDRRIKNSPTFEELAIRAADIADARVPAALEAARSYKRYKADQKTKARLSRNFFIDESGGRSNMPQIVVDLLRQPGLKKASIDDLWTALYSRLYELGLDPELSDCSKRSEQRLVYGYKENAQRDKARFSRDPGEDPRRFRVKYNSFANLVRKYRGASASFLTV